MNVVVVNNKTGKVTFSFSEDKNNAQLQQLSAIVESGEFAQGKHPFLGYIVAKEKGKCTFYISYPGVGNRKAANYRAKIFLNAISDFLSYREYERDIYSKIFDFAFHNTNNIHHALLGNLKELIDWEQFLHSEDKISAIREVIISDSYKSAREILNALKSLEQIDFEYNIIDFLQPGIELQDQDFTDIRLHTLLVLSFYIFEKDFSDKSIRVNIDKCNYVIRGNFFTLRSAFMLVFENCTKYCARGSEVTIDFTNLQDVLKVDLDMTSVVNEDTELTKVFTPYFRGENAKKCTTKGDGLGLYIAHQLFNLNRIAIDLRRIDAHATTIDGVEYCRNVFVVDIPREQVIG